MVFITICGSSFFIRLFIFAGILGYILFTILFMILSSIPRKLPMYRNIQYIFILFNSLALALILFCKNNNNNNKQKPQLNRVGLDTFRIAIGYNDILFSTVKLNFQNSPCVLNFSNIYLIYITLLLSKLSCGLWR